MKNKIEDVSGSRVLLMLMIVMLVIQPICLGLADTITTLSDGKTEDTVDFSASGTNSDLTISVPFDGVVSSATLVVEAGPHSAGGKDYPTDPALDVSGDGDVEWAFQGQGYGAMGHQSVFQDGSDRLGFEAVRPESNTSASITLPKSADILSAQLEVDGVAGYDLWDEKEIHRQVMGEEIGHSCAGLGDVNGDGFDDFGSMGRGTALIFFGEYGGVHDTPDIVLSIGFSISTIWGIGDVNNDGNNDVLIGTGVHFGGDTMNASVDVALASLGKGNNFGRSASYIGDFNNDGVDDVLVGDAGDGAAYVGAAYVYYGGANMDGDPDFIFDNPTGMVQEGFGDSVTFAGDLDNDGFDDIAISAMWAGASNEGLVYIYYGSNSWDNTSDLQLNGDLDGGSWPKFGNFISGGGDLDNDGFDDLVVGAYNDDVNGSDAGKVYVFFGGDPMDSDEDLEIFGSGANARLGLSVELSEDLNGDGIADLLLNEQGNIGGTGTVYVYYGSNNMDNTSDWSVSLGDGDYSYAKSVADAGDINGMGRSSVIMGAPQEWMNRYGKIFIYNIVPMDPADMMLYLEEQRVWNHTGLFNDHITTADLSTQLETALGNLSATADGYGNQMVDVVVNLTCVKGSLNITNLSIEYSYEAAVPDFSSEINDHLVGASGPEDVVVPLNITVSSAGKVTIRDIMIEHTKNEPPVAFIDSISPDPARLYGNITFVGHGTDTDGTIDGYRWSSDRMGLLSTEEAPVLNNLSVGTHMISFQVVDDKGRWSSIVNEEIVVRKPNIHPAVTVTAPTEGQVITGIFEIVGTATDLDPDPLTVFLRIDGGTWEEALGNGSWSYSWDTTLVDDGGHILDARAWDTYDNSSIVTVNVIVNNTEIGDKPVHFTIHPPVDQLGLPGETLEYEFTITNRGGLGDTYDIEAASSHGWNVAVVPSTLALDPGKGSVVKVRLSVPDTAENGEDLLTFTVRSTMNDSLIKTFTVTTKIGIPGVEVTFPEDFVGNPGQTIDVYFGLKNNGTISDKYILKAWTESSWKVDIRNLQGNVTGEFTPDTRVTVAVQVEVPEDVVGPLLEVVTLRATSVTDPTTMAEGETVIIIGGIDVTITSPENQTSKPGRNVTYEFMVTNNGTIRAAFLIVGVSSNGWDMNLTVTRVELNPGNSVVIVVNLSIPDKTKKGTEDELRIVVSAELDESITAVGNVTTTVKAKKRPGSDNVIPGYTSSTVIATFSLASLLIFLRRRRGN